MADVAVVTKMWRSGTSWVVLLLVQAMAEQGVKVAFVAPLSEPLSREPSHANVERIVTARELMGPANRLARTIASFRRIGTGIAATLGLRASTRTFIFSIPEPLLLTIPLFAFLRASGARIIFIVHDAEPHAWHLPMALRTVERNAHRLSYKFANDLVTLTKAAAETLIEKYRIPSGKISVIPHGPLELNAVSDVPGSRKLLIFGSLRRNKRVLDVIEAIKIVRRTDPSVRLVVAGEPLAAEPGYWEECLQAIAEDRGGFDLRVGFVRDEDIPGIVSAVDAFVLAYEDFTSQSGVGVMALMARRPVIGTASGGLRELYGRGMAGELIAEPVTPQGIADAMSAFFSKPIEEWRVVAAQGAANASGAVSWTTIAHQYMQLAGLSLPRD